MFHRRHLLAPLPFLLLLTGCKTTPNAGAPSNEPASTASDTAATTTPPRAATAPPEAEIKTAAVIKADDASVMRAMGCAEEQIEATRCGSCVGAWSNGEGEEDSVEEISIEYGRFGQDDTKQHAHLTYLGCSSRAAGEYSHVHLERDDAGSDWRVVAHTRQNGAPACQRLQSSEGITHLLCQTFYGQQGVYSNVIYSPNFAKMAIEHLDGELDKGEAGERLYIAETSNEEEATDNLDEIAPTPDAKILEVKDLDGDGDDDALLLIDTDRVELIQEKDRFVLRASAPTK